MSTTKTEAIGEGERVSREEIEAKLREIRGEVDAVGDANRSWAMVVAATAAVAIVAGAYLLGKRRAKKKTTVVEVRRV